MKPASFGYHRPRNVAEAIQLLEASNGDARLLAGGQSLVPMMNFRVARPSALVDLADCSELEGIRVEGDYLCIAAMTRQRKAELDPLVKRHCPLISDALAHAGSVTIRNRATVGGSIANAYPTAQLLAVAVCLKAQVSVESVKGRRIVAAEDFYEGPFQTVLTSDEVVREIRFPIEKPGSRHFFDEVGNHAGGGAQAVFAGYSTFDGQGGLSEIRLVVLGIAPTPFRLRNTETALLDGYTLGLSHEAWQRDMTAAASDCLNPKDLDFRVDTAYAMVSNAIKRWTTPDPRPRVP